jgi:hypothetical protein
VSEGEGQKQESAELQFDKVDAVPDAVRVCSRCQARFEQEYFEAAGNFICPACARQIGGESEPAAFWRAAGYGAGAALLGTIIWYSIVALTSYEFGLIAIVVGLFVGYAVRKGSRGRGGWRYQALAMALTYVSITASYIPLVIEAAQEQDVVENGASAVAEATLGGEAEGAARASLAELGLAMLFVFAIALASPFLSGVENIMGLIIIAIGLYEAWKLNKRVVVTGPYHIRAGPAPAPP